MTAGRLLVWCVLAFFFFCFFSSQVIIALNTATIPLGFYSERDCHQVQDDDDDFFSFVFFHRSLYIAHIDILSPLTASCVFILANRELS